MRSRFYLMLFVALISLQNTSGAPLPYAGVNLAGAEFGESVLPGTYGTHYTYPTIEELDYFKSKRMNIIRLQFRWERLQQTLNSPFDSAEWARLDAVVQAALTRDLVVILDPHNYARYNGNLIGSAQVPVTAFADFWSRLAQAYSADENVWFGLMNEPHTMVTENWLTAANAAIAAIRTAGATNRILVPGNAWSGAFSWLHNWYGTPNGTVMSGIVDPGNNYILEVHQYLDSDSSGTHDTVVSPTIGAERLVAFTQWCRARGIRALLGEFAVARNQAGYTAVDNMLDYMEDNADVWLGWAWWAAGPWWGEYMFTLEPQGLGTTNVTDRPQMITLESHIPAADLDSDGMIDTWEISYFGNTNILGGAATADWDNDGMLNLSEYIAGTDPTNAASFLELSIAYSNSAVAVQYNAQATTADLYPNRLRYYDVYETDTLTNSWAASSHTNQLGNNTMHVYNDPTTNDTAFFELRTRLEKEF